MVVSWHDIIISWHETTILCHDTTNFQYNCIHSYVLPEASM